MPVDPRWASEETNYSFSVKTPPNSRAELLNLQQKEPAAASIGKYTYTIKRNNFDTTQMGRQTR